MSAHRTHYGRGTAGRSALAILILSGSLWGCGETAASPGWAGTMDTLPGGTVVVHNPATGAIPIDSLWGVEVLARIGSIQGGSPASFGNVSDIAVDGLGRVWVLERQAKEIRIFHEDGTFIRSVGQEGGGPGEFQDPIGIAAGPGGTMWVMDPVAARISVFDTAGAFVTSYRRESGGYSFSWRGGFRNRHYYDLVYAPARERFVLLRFDESMESADTVALPSRPERGPTFELQDDEGRTRITASVPFTPGIRWTLGPAGDFRVTYQTPYRLYRLSPAHDTLRVAERAYEPVAVTDADRQAEVEGLEWFTAQGGEVDAGLIPDVKPAVDDFFVDRLGYLWVKPYRAHGDTARAYDVFDPDGVFLGTLPLPMALGGPPIITADRIYTLFENELGVEYVGVLALDRLRDDDVPGPAE